jgi:hypothetical protein
MPEVSVGRTSTSSAKRLSYLSDLEILTALVTNLAMTEYWHRTPPNLAKSLSIDESEITRVLDSYKGLFRKSGNKSKPSGYPLYTLQLRHARQWLKPEDDSDDAKKPPLEPEYLVALLDFISRRADEETRRRYTVAAAWIAAGVAVLASIANIVVTLITNTPSTVYQ